MLVNSWVRDCSVRVLVYVVQSERESLLHIEKKSLDKYRGTEDNSDGEMGKKTNKEVNE